MKLKTLAALLLCAAALTAARAQDAEALKARHTALREQLANNQFQRPLYLESTQTSGNLKGDVYALIEQPYMVVGQALQAMDHWCDILMLHLNVKQCRASGTGPSSMLSLTIGSKHDQSVEDAYKVDFGYKVAAATQEYLQVMLNAESGPVGTSNYRIVLEAVPLDAGSSFIHMSYAYGYGLAARLAMQGYLATIGRNKVGFSIIDRHPDGKPVYIGNVRGVVERNTMRYYLAIVAYLGAYAMPAADQQEKRLHDWFAGVERYPAQLHELERSEYMEMKRREIQRQQVAGKQASPG